MTKIHISVKPAKAAAQKIQVQSLAGSASINFVKAHKLAAKREAAIQNCDSVSVRVK